MTTRVPSHDPLIGLTLGHYRIIEKVGSGGMGLVYKAQDTALDRFVALKFLSEDVEHDALTSERFLREARVTSALNHPHICTIYDIVEYDGRPFLVMEFLEGQTLNQRIGGKPLPVNDLLDLSVQIVEALEAAHAKGIVHRDVKPSNIFVNAQGQTKVLDFGLAKLALRCPKPVAVGVTSQETAVTEEYMTSPGMMMGTIQYMSPEQARGEEVDARADLFSFGVVLFEMATGQPAFTGRTSTVILDAILNREPTPAIRLNPSLPEELQRILDKALEKDREMRYQTAADIRVDLKRLKRDLDSPRGRDRTSAARPKETALRERKITAARIKAIAVLPLVNLSRDPEQEYFADGMTEALITDLAQIGALRVISRTSAMRYKGTGRPLPEIARELNVDALVEGSVLRAGERVRITAQLIHAATDQHLWARSYERDLRDALALQAEVARAIAEEVQIKLTPQERVKLARPRPVNPAAHEAYLKARYYLAKSSEQALKKSIAYFEQAIECDPSYALPYTGLVDAYNVLTGGFLELVPQRTIIPKVRAMAAKALELDDTLAEAHVSIGRTKFYFDWDWAGAEKSFQRAIELNPNLCDAHRMYALLLTSQQRQEEAIHEAQRSLILDPVSLLAHVAAGLVYCNARQFEDAERQLRKALELDPNYMFAHELLGVDCLAPTARYDEAVVELEKAVALAKNVAITKGGLGYVYAKSGRRAEALRVLEELDELSKNTYVTPIAAAGIYAGLRDDRVFEALEEAYQQRCPQIVWARVAPYWDEVRSHPRFQDLLRRMNFPA